MTGNLVQPTKPLLTKPVKAGNSFHHEHWSRDLASCCDPSPLLHCHRWAAKPTWIFELHEPRLCQRRANVQQLTCKMVWSFSFYSLLFSFIIFSSLWAKTVVKPLNSEKKSWRKNSENSEKVWKCVEKCQNVWKSAETILPFSCCPLVFLCLWCNFWSLGLCNLSSSLGTLTWIMGKWKSWTSCSPKKKAHKHKSFWPVTPPVTGGSPDGKARGQSFMCYPRNPRNINLFVRVPDREDRWPRRPEKVLCAFSAP